MQKIVHYIGLDVHEENTRAAIASFIEFQSKGG